MLILPKNDAKLLQPKFKIGKHDDTYEWQAYRLADAVVHIPDSQVQMQPMKEWKEEL